MDLVDSPYSLTPFCPSLQEYIRHRTLQWEKDKISKRFEFSKHIFEETFAQKDNPTYIHLHLFTRTDISNPGNSSINKLVVAEPAILKRKDKTGRSVSVENVCLTLPPKSTITKQDLICRINSFGLNT